jgi:hypothetical protein
MNCNDSVALRTDEKKLSMEQRWEDPDRRKGWEDPDRRKGGKILTEETEVLSRYGFVHHKSCVHGMTSVT